MNGLDQVIRKRVRKAVRSALQRGPTNLASTESVGGENRVRSAYADHEVAVVSQDGETTVVRRDH